MGLSSDVTDADGDEQLKSDNEARPQSGPMGLRPDLLLKLSQSQISGKLRLNPAGSPRPLPA